MKKILLLCFAAMMAVSVIAVNNKQIIGVWKEVNDHSRTPTESYFGFMQDGTYVHAQPIKDQGIITFHIGSYEFRNNTLCLPFDLSANEVQTYFDGCNLYSFESAAMNGGGLDLYLAEEDAIEAGVPYLIRWEPGTNIEEQTYTNVTIKAAQGQAVGEGVQFVGAIGRAQLEGGNENYLFLGAENKLNWPNTSNKLRAFRAYFIVSGSVAPHGAPARLVIRPKTPTGIENTEYRVQNTYIQKVLRDGQLIIIKDGKEFNVQGQIVNF